MTDQSNSAIASVVMRPTSPVRLQHAHVAVGEQTEEVLAEFGFAADEIADLRQREWSDAASSPANEKPRQDRGYFAFSGNLSTLHPVLARTQYLATTGPAVNS
jgi:hypothetical protein